MYPAKCHLRCTFSVLIPNRFRCKGIHFLRELRGNNVPVGINSVSGEEYRSLQLPDFVQQTFNHILFLRKNRLRSVRCGLPQSGIGLVSPGVDNRADVFLPAAVLHSLIRHGFQGGHRDAGEIQNLSQSSGCRDADSNSRKGPRTHRGSDMRQICFFNTGVPKAFFRQRDDVLQMIHHIGRRGRPAISFLIDHCGRSVLTGSLKC